MGSFPTDDLTVVNLDSVSDSPAAARGELLAAVNKIKSIIASYAAANGLAPLDASTKLATSYLNATDVTALLNIATTSLKGLLSAADKTKLDSLSNFTLPVATASVLGGIKVGAGLTITSGVVTVSLNGVTPLQLTNPTVGDYAMVSSDNEEAVPGNITFVGISKNGAAVTTPYTTDGFHSEDLTLVAGDLIQLWGTIISSPTTKLKEIIIPRNGTYRVSFEIVSSMTIVRKFRCCVADPHQGGTHKSY